MAKISMPKSWWRQLGEVARDNDDEQTWRLSSYLQLDTERCLRRSEALAKYARAEAETCRGSREARDRVLVGMGLGVA